MIFRRCLSSAFVVSLAACHATQPAPSPAAPPPATPVATVTAVDAGAPPVDPRREALLAAGRAASPNDHVHVSVLGEIVDVPDPSPRVAAVMMLDQQAMLVMTPVPFVAGAQATGYLSAHEPAQETIAGLVARDVNGDHKTDLAVFVRAEETTEGYAPLQRFAQFYTLRTEPEPTLASMVRVELQLLGVRDDAGLVAALPTLDAYEPPAAGMSPARFLARLRYATPAQFRAAVAPTGLRLCTDFPDRTGNRHKRCATTPAARLTDAQITGSIRRSLGEFADIVTDNGDALQMPSCERRGRELHCNANIGGPAGVDWSFVGEGETLRIIEISPWAESS